MFNEHADTDKYVAALKEAFALRGIDVNGLHGVKQDGFYEGNGPFFHPKPDFIEFPSGLDVPTDAFAWNVPRWGLDWYIRALAATESSFIGNHEQHMDIRTGRTCSEPLTTPSPCLYPFYPMDSPLRPQL